jgi:hypothetical protein
MNALQTLCYNLVDYAGLFPPATLELSAVVSNYRRYQAEPQQWLLGRLIIPAARLEEFAALYYQQGPTHQRPWSISALLRTEHDITLVTAFNERYTPHLRVEAMEIVLTTPAAIHGLARQLPAGISCYVELPAEAATQPLIGALNETGLRAKLRTGGVSSIAFPTSERLLHLLATCIEHDVPFKATAGLHHALAGQYRLTYAADSPRSSMYGFLNLLLTAAALRSGVALAEAQELLTSSTPPRLSDNGTRIMWHNRAWPISELVELRTRGMISFGSCSFDEPCEELEQLFGIAALQE